MTASRASSVVICGKHASQHHVVVVPVGVYRYFTNHRVVPLAKVGLLAGGHVCKFNLLAYLDYLFPSIFALVHLLRLVVLHQGLEIGLLQRFKIHRLGDLIDGLWREVKTSADYVQAIRRTAETRLCCEESVRKDGPHFLLFLEVVLQELAEVVVIKQMF